MLAECRRALLGYRAAEGGHALRVARAGCRGRGSCASTTQDLVELLTIEMARTPTVNGQAADSVLEEVVQTAHARGYLSEGGLAYARNVLEKAIGVEAAGRHPRPGSPP